MAYRLGDHVVCGETGAEGVVTQLGEEKGPRVGWRLSTRARWATAKPLSTQPSNRNRR